MPIYAYYLKQTFNTPSLWNRKGTVAQHETRRHFAQLEKSGKDIPSLLGSTMIYTLIDKDHFKGSSAYHPIVMNTDDLDKDMEPYLGAAVNDIHTGDPGLNRRSKEISNKLYKDKQFKSMHICLATEVVKLTSPFLPHPHPLHLPSPLRLMKQDLSRKMNNNQHSL